MSINKSAINTIKTAATATKNGINCTRESTQQKRWAVLMSDNYMKTALVDIALVKIHGENRSVTNELGMYDKTKSYRICQPCIQAWLGSYHTWSMLHCLASYCSWKVIPHMCVDRQPCQILHYPSKHNRFDLYSFGNTCHQCSWASVVAQLAIPMSLVATNLLYLLCSAWSR